MSYYCCQALEDMEDEMRELSRTILDSTPTDKEISRSMHLSRLIWGHNCDPDGYAETQP